jgi:hypothetical protein
LAVSPEQNLYPVAKRSFCHWGELFFAKILPRRKPMAFLRGRTLTFDNFRSGEAGRKRGGGKMNSRPAPRFLPRSEREAFYYWGSAAEFRASEAGAPLIIS